MLLNYAAPNGAAVLPLEVLVGSPSPPLAAVVPPAVPSGWVAGIFRLLLGVG